MLFLYPFFAGCSRATLFFRAYSQFNGKLTTENNERGSSLLGSFGEQFKASETTVASGMLGQISDLTKSAFTPLKTVSERATCYCCCACHLPLSELLLLENTICSAFFVFEKTSQKQPSSRPSPNCQHCIKNRENKGP